MIQDIAHIQKNRILQGQLETNLFPSNSRITQHPELGYILFDTGYAGHFKEATKNSLTLYMQN